MGNQKLSFRVGLKRARKRAGYKTQEEFANGIKKSIETVRNWEQGKTKPSLDDFIQLCEDLSCDADYLLDNLDEQTHDIDFICKYTGLSSEAVQLLHNLNERGSTEEKRTISFINRVLSNPISPGRPLVETTVFSWMEQYVTSTTVKLWDMLNKKVIANPGIQMSSGLTEAIEAGSLYSEFLINRIRYILDKYREREDKKNG